jgi:pimeloyl-ACP methyl ester carboxylesterase
MELVSFQQSTSHLGIAGLKNDQHKGSPVIAIHGWLDNAASFLPLSSHLELSRPFYAIDLPGHGFSDHRPVSSSYHLVENIIDVLAFIDSLGLVNSTKDDKQDQVTLVGHSLGGIICCLVAAAAPERINSVILLDSLGPLTDETENVLPQLRKAVTRAMQIKSKISIFPDLELAVRARMVGVGNIKREAAEALVLRGTKKVEGGYTWTTDPKLLKPSFLRFSEAQVKAIFSGITCPVKLLRGETGYFSKYESLKNRLAYFKNIEQMSIKGGHHFHMDGDICKTAEYLNAYLNN